MVGHQECTMEEDTRDNYTPKFWRKVTVHAFLLISASLNIKVGSNSKVLRICEGNEPVLIHRVTLKMEISPSPS